MTGQNWVSGLPDHVKLPKGKIPRIVAVGGGKGGVGKSIVSANLAARIAKLGLKVTVVDLDLGCANIHTYFGLQSFDQNIQDYFSTGSISLSDVCVKTPYPNIELIPGGNQTQKPRLNRLWNDILKLKQMNGSEFVILDLGAGTMPHTMEAFSLAHCGIAAALAEPTSIENVYVFMRTFISQLIDNTFKRANAVEVGLRLKEELNDLRFSSQHTYPVIFNEFALEYPHLIDKLKAAISCRPFGILLNQSRCKKDVDIGNAVQTISQKYFGINSFFAGDLASDEAAWKSLRNRRLLLDDFPHSQFAKGLGKVCKRIVSTMMET